MKSVIINLNAAEAVKSFVDLMNKFPYDIDLRCGRYVVNAKSALGVFSLDLAGPLVLEIYSDDCNDLISALSPYIEE